MVFPLKGPHCPYPQWLLKEGVLWVKKGRGFLAPLHLPGLLDPRREQRLRAPAWAGAWTSALALVTPCAVRSC